MVNKNVGGKEQVLLTVPTQGEEESDDSVKW